MNIARPGPCPHCDDDHIKASCLAPFGVYGGCKSARIVWDAGYAAGVASCAETQTEIDADRGRGR
jgi:hypothetical protein